MAHLRDRSEAAGALRTPQDNGLGRAASRRRHRARAGATVVTSGELVAARVAGLSTCSRTTEVARWLRPSGWSWRTVGWRYDMANPRVRSRASSGATGGLSATADRESQTQTGRRAADPACRPRHRRPLHTESRRGAQPPATTSRPRRRPSSSSSSAAGTFEECHPPACRALTPGELREHRIQERVVQRSRDAKVTPIRRTPSRRFGEPPDRGTAHRTGRPGVPRERRSPLPGCPQRPGTRKARDHGPFLPGDGRSWTRTRDLFLIREAL
jgi:hypothetical protein